MPNNIADTQDEKQEETTNPAVQNPEESSPSQSPAPEMTLEEALAELEKTRQERDAVQAAAQKWQQHEDSQKTELQLAQEKLAAAQQELAQAQTTNLLLEVAAAHGIKPEDVPLLGTGTKEDLEARAARIKELYGAGNAAPPSNSPRQNVQSGSGVGNEPQPDPVTYPSSWMPKALRKNHDQ